MRKAVRWMGIAWLCAMLALPGPGWGQPLQPAQPSRPGATGAANATEAARIRQAMIDASIAGYAGNCPCPYNTMRNGRRCGTRSAYSKPGGAAPLCYPADISEAMVEQYRRGR